MDRPNAFRASTQLDRLPSAPWPSKMTNVSILPPLGFPNAFQASTQLDRM